MSTNALFGRNSAACSFVCLAPGPEITGIQIAAILAHEAVHIWQLIRREIGEDKPGDEGEAYAVQHITQELLQAYADLTIKRRKRRK